MSSHLILAISGFIGGYISDFPDSAEPQLVQLVNSIPFPACSTKATMAFFDPVSFQDVKETAGKPAAFGTPDLGLAFRIILQ